MNLAIYMNGLFVGTLSKSNNGALSFLYDKDWIRHPAGRPLSLSLPLQTAPHKGPEVFNYFENLLPDSKALRERIQSRLKIRSSHPFDLLHSIGRDCVGAIQLVEENEKPTEPRLDGVVLDDENIAQTLAKFEHLPLGMSREEKDFRISLAGAQEKMAFLRRGCEWLRPLGNTPTSHIFKLPIGRLTQHGIDLSTSCENEWLCLKIAQAMGFDVANAEIANFKSQKVLIVERFDRRLSSDGKVLLRLPTEDFCQTFGISGALKYESDGGPGIVECMERLQGSQFATQDRHTFFRVQILFWMLAAIDGHAKNFSLYLKAQDQYALAPLYDILSAYPLFANKSLQKQKAKMAMALKGKNSQYHWSRIQVRHFFSTGKLCGLSEKLVTKWLEEMAECALTICETMPSTLPKDFPKEVSQAIFDGLKQQALKIKMALS